MNHNKKRKLRVGILFGGKSAEHEVSLMSAKNVIKAIDKEKFEPVLIGIDKTGKWHTYSGHRLGKGGTISLPDSSEASSVTLVPGSDKYELVGAYDTDLRVGLDVVFPVLHGPMGEDGTIQGFLELADLPYVGSGILGSAIGMDKDVAKRLLRDAGIRITDFMVVREEDLDGLDAKSTISDLSLPIFVKPANMGSSVGVSKVDREEDLLTAIHEALKYDTKVLLERAVFGDEIECSVLGNATPKASAIGRVIPQEDGYYSYNAKYIDEDGAILEIPANISKVVSDEAKRVALKTFKVLGCEGMARVDMFATKDGSIIVNEVNTIPGFTGISMYPKLWEVSGVSYEQLINELVQLAIERYDRRHKLKTSYKNKILN